MMLYCFYFIIIITSFFIPFFKCYDDNNNNDDYNSLKENEIIRHVFVASLFLAENCHKCNVFLV